MLHATAPTHSHTAFPLRASAPLREKFFILVDPRRLRCLGFPFRLYSSFYGKKATDPVFYATKKQVKPSLSATKQENPERNRTNENTQAGNE
jgi:hypothetical protein